jgi:hypothetical protein
LLLIAEAADQIIDEFTGISTGARTHLGLKEIFNIFSQRDCHD